MRQHRPTSIDLFSGAGGLSEGLRQAGMDPRVAVDFDTHAMRTYRANHPEAETILGDVAEVTGQQLMRLAGTDDIDLIAGGPSCQGFSTHGKRIQDDPRNYLFKHFVRLVDEVRPKIFLMENVRGMLTYSKGLFRQQIEDAFEEIGYRTRFTTVCAADYGVPQLRHRVLFIGTRLESIELKFPSPKYGGDDTELRPYVTVGEAFGDLPLMGQDYKSSLREYAGPPSNDFQTYVRRGSSDPLTLHVSGPLSEQACKIAQFVGQGEGLRSVPVQYLPERFKRMRTISNGSLRRDCTTLYHRLHPHKPAYTVTCYYRNVASGPFLHPWENRALSHREAARLMSFPDSYRFEGANLPRQIGNAVPVLMAKAMGESIIESLSSAQVAANSRLAAD